MNELKKNNQQILKIFCVIMLTARKNYVSTTTRSKFKRKSGINNFSLLPHRQRKFRIYTKYSRFSCQNAEWCKTSKKWFWKNFRCECVYEWTEKSNIVYSRLYLPCLYLPCRFLLFSLELFPHHDRDGSASENCFSLYLRCRQCFRSFHVILKCKKTLYVLLMRCKTEF